MNQRTKLRLQLHGLYREPANDGVTAGSTSGGSGGGDEGQGGDSGSGTGTGGEGGTGDDGNKAKPTDAEARMLRDVMKHKEAARKLQEQLDQATGQLKQFEGIDPKAVRALLDKQAEDERKRMEDRGEYDRLVQQMGQRHAEELNRVKESSESLAQANAALTRQIADLTVGSQFASSNFVKEGLTLTPTKARVIYGSHFEFKDGAVIAFDKPAGAPERTPLVDSVGKPLGFDAALKHLVENDPDKDHLIRSQIKPGAGSNTQPVKDDKSKDRKLTPAQRIAAGLRELAKQN